MFKLSKPKCSECGEPAEGTIDMIPGIAQFIGDEGDGINDWSGHTRVCWDGQMSDENEEGTLVMCREGHEWRTKIEDVEDEEELEDSPCTEDCAVHAPGCDGFCDHGFGGTHTNGCQTVLEEARELPQSESLMSDALMDALVEQNPELVDKFEAAIQRRKTRTGK